ncbi:MULTISPECIES: peptidase [unclassified Streptomyces]|uniref:peptidase n=1 Tax=unclassified Streptomyces TaxID=2593676 RepID=UPI000DAED34A|nr:MULTISPECIES: peptidase [unclassified Streptomyces]PZT76192.1 peptidase [Streptomyces sp. AC1-42W]PZT79855.1 peptidase [Streptomyces sp. AC1-42T]
MGVLASAGLLAAGTLTTAGPAHAAGPEFTIGGPAETALHPYPATGAPQKASLALTLTNPSEDEENGAYQGEYTVRFDFGGLAGVADVAFGEDGSLDCERTGTTAVCHDYGIWPGVSTLADLEVTAAKGSEDGDSGTIEVTAEAAGATFRPFTARVSVGGPDLSMKRLPFRTELKPGDSRPVPISFTNHGTRAARGVLLTLRNTRGLAFTQRYQNCEYSEDEGGMGSPGVWTTALCSFPGSYEPGTTYTLAEPPVLRATGHALYDSLLYRINEDGTDARAAQRAGARFSPGNGAALVLRKAPTPRSGDLEPGDNQQEADFRTANTADFAAYGDRAAGKAGDTVDVTLGFRNRGPAWIGHIRSGEDVATVDFTVPHGSYVVSKPDVCRGVTAQGGYRENQAKAPRYFCSTPMSVLEDADFALPFRLKIVTADPGSTGAVVVRNIHLQAPELPFDPKPANNKAYVELNGEESGTTGGTSGSGSGSGSGGTAATGGSGSAGATGSTGGASSSAGGGTSGTSGASGTAGSGGSDGALASTGTLALAASGAALAVLLAGGVLFATARRRATR